MAQRMAERNTSFKIREAEAPDRPHLLPLFEELQAYECGLHPNRADPGDVAEPHWAYLENAVNRQDGKIWVAEQDDGKIVGFILALVEESEPYLIESDRRSGYVSDIVVANHARGAGIGAALMAQAEQHFRAIGLSQMLVGALCANNSARKFYERGGFCPYEMVYEKRLDNLQVPEVVL